MAVVKGTNNSDLIDGNWGVTNGDDIIYGYGGSDIIKGAGGSDKILGGEGADELYGGAGSDWAWYTDSDEGVLVLLFMNEAYYGTAEGDTFNSIENIFGSAYDDALYGDAGDNLLQGYAGDDHLGGGAGADVLQGDTGIDVASYLDSRAAVTVSLMDHVGYGGDAEGDKLYSIENVVGSAYDDWLYGDDGDNGLNGSDGNDTLKGFGGADQLHGGYGDDELYGMHGDDTLRGFGDSDTLWGGDGADQLFGQDGNDTLYGENGDPRGGPMLSSTNHDTLDGGAGNDALIGGVGNDSLTGGADVDAFWFTTALNNQNNIDIITDFTVADQDAIVLDNAIFTNLVGSGSNIADFELRIGPAAADADDRIIYDNVTGAMYYDADGSGATDAIQFASLTPGLALTHFQFIIV